jgi:hypothetical protein
MSASTAVMTSSTSVKTWERLWRTAGIQFVGLCIIACAVYGYLPGVGVRMRIAIAAVFSGLAVLNLMWFVAALRTALVDAGEDGWGAAATAASAAVGGLFTLLIALGVAGSAYHPLTSELHDFAWALAVLTSFPRAMLIMSATFGLWRANLISNALFAMGVGIVVLGVLGGTTWASAGFWAPAGAYSRLVLPAISLVWVLVVSRVLLTRAPATGHGW